MARLSTLPRSQTHKGYDDSPSTQREPHLNPIMQNPKSTASVEFLIPEHMTAAIHETPATGSWKRDS